MAQVKQMLSLLVGAAADFAMPHLGREIDLGLNTKNAAKIKRAIINFRMYRSAALKDQGQIQSVLQSFWENDAGDQFHIKSGRGSFEYFLKHHATAVDTLDMFVRASGLRFTRLVEVGCGNGAVLDYFVDKLPWIEHAVGIDINAQAISLAVGRTRGSRIEFVCAEAGAWLTTNPQAGTVMLCNGGVLEYFSQQSVDQLLQAAAASAPAAILLLEPQEKNFDSDRDLNSYTFASEGGAGWETTFSHNYGVRLKQAGFEVVMREETRFGAVQGVVMLGVRG